MNVDLVSKIYEVDRPQNLKPEAQSHNLATGENLFANSGYDKDISTRYMDPQMIEKASQQPFNRDQSSVQYKHLERSDSKDLPIDAQNPVYISQNASQEDPRNMPGSQRQFYPSSEQPNNETEQYRYMPEKPNQGYEYESKQAAIPDSNKMGYQTEQYQYGQGNEQESSPSYQWPVSSERSQNLDPMYNVQQSEPLR